MQCTGRVADNVFEPRREDREGVAKVETCADCLSDFVEGDDLAMRTADVLIDDWPAVAGRSARDCLLRFKHRDALMLYMLLANLSFEFVQMMEKSADHVWVELLPALFSIIWTNSKLRFASSMS